MATARLHTTMELSAESLYRARRTANPYPRFGLYQEKSKLPVPSHRHAAPSAPWPWINIHDGEPYLVNLSHLVRFASDPHSSGIDQNQLWSRLPPIPELCDHRLCDECWKGYPQSRFPNWTPDQVIRCKIRDAVWNYDREASCTIYQADVLSDGFFTNVPKIVATEENREVTWEVMVNTEVRLFSPALATYICSMKSRPFFPLLFPR